MGREEECVEEEVDVKAGKLSYFKTDSKGKVRRVAEGGSRTHSDSGKLSAENDSGKG